MRENMYSTINLDKDDMGKFILRFTIAFLMLFHGISKAQNGIGFIMGMLDQVNLPSFVAYGVFLGQIVAPIMLIIGFRVRIAAILIIITMIGAIGLAHSTEIFSLTKHGAWAIELQMFYIMAAIVIFLQNSGKYNINSFLSRV